MAKPLITFIGTSSKKLIRSGGAVMHYDWGTKGKWTKFKSPVADSQKKVKYSASKKSKAGSQSAAYSGGVTKLGTTIPSKAEVYIDGVLTRVDVRYRQRGYVIYTKTSALKAQKKMSKTTYTKAKPYQYQLQYKDKPYTEAAYSEYVDGVDYLYFWDYYFDNGRQATSGHLPHPVECTITYSDVDRSQDTSNANNGQERDNKGKYVLQRVRANVVTLNLTWQGLTQEEGTDLLDTLNPDEDHPYLIVQYYDGTTNKYKNGTFYAGEREVVRHASGIIESISVTLTEV